MAEDRFRRLRLPPGDVAAAAVLLVAMTAVRLGAGDGADASPPVVLALGAVIAAGLAVRRRAPLAGYVVGTAGLVVEALWVGPGQLTPVANLIGVHSLGLYATPRRAVLGALLVPPGVLAHFASKDDPWVTEVAVVLVWLLVWSAGCATARRRRETEELRRLLRRETVVAERVRIARELHDVVGHSVNAMLVQAGAGRMVLDTDPERTRELLMSVERTGRDALAELDRLLGVLRADDDATDATGDTTVMGATTVAGATGGPAPDRTTPDDTDLDPAYLGQLVRPMVDAGMDVRVCVEPETLTLPRALRLSVHRIVQEALTNALRHGHARSAEVTVRRQRWGNAVLVTVVDGGAGPPPEYRPGRGLRGIGERAAALGGSVAHGPADDGAGFALTVELPLP
ncbi:Histidine kinase-, DNA gyrase B-, and HSP90-like ATPase [Streptomyces sp. cf124]|uniref:sensor histidine kinase n=1 Tax=Streptomyces sp. cf124 TaxID=1761903 RepID=UPI0008F45698|nr:histidine kinase [Streptomyces sp. cf124]SFN50596.1 Histidine kinase-, DNA gyrase B-, and HSP90-like ATPase [Streptomyces sp. cf124]